MRGSSDKAKSYPNNSSAYTPLTVLAHIARELTRHSAKVDPAVTRQLRDQHADKFSAHQFSISSNKGVDENPQGVALPTMASQKPVRLGRAPSSTAEIKRNITQNKNVPGSTIREMTSRRSDKFQFACRVKNCSNEHCAFRHPDQATQRPPKPKNNGHQATKTARISAGQPRSYSSAASPQPVTSPPNELASVIARALEQYFSSSQ